MTQAAEPERHTTVVRKATPAVRVEPGADDPDGTVLRQPAPATTTGPAAPSGGAPSYDAGPAVGPARTDASPADAPRVDPAPTEMAPDDPAAVDGATAGPGRIDAAPRGTPAGAATTAPGQVAAAPEQNPTLTAPASTAADVTASTVTATAVTPAAEWPPPTTAAGALAPAQPQPAAPGTASASEIATIQPAAPTVAGHPLSPRTGEPRRPALLAAACAVLYGGAVTAAAGLLQVLWDAATIAGFRTSARLVTWFPELEIVSFQTIVLVLTIGLIGVLVTGTAGAAAYNAWNGHPWTRVGGLVAVAVSLLALMLNPLASASIVLVVAGAAMLWLPQLNPYLAAWRAIREPHQAAPHLATHVHYGPLPRYIV